MEPRYWCLQAKQLQHLEKEQVDRLKEKQRQDSEAQQQEVVAAMKLLRKIVDRDSHTLGTLEKTYARTHRSSDSYREVQEREEKHQGEHAQTIATEGMQLDGEVYIFDHV